MSEQVRKDDRIVEKVRIVVHTTGAWPNGRMSDNHWSIYLVFPDNKGSVRMNMRAELDDPTGHLEWSPSLMYTMSNSAIKSWDYKAVTGVSVKKIYTVIMNNGRDKYNMSGGGSGCRYWVYIIVKDLEDGGYLLKKGAGTDLWEKLLHQYSNTGHTKPLAMVKGEFTAAKSKSAAAPPTSSASSAAPAPKASTKATTEARTQVSVQSYMMNGQLCYSWKRDGVEDRSYAKDWISFTDKTGKPCVFQKAKNLFSLAP